MNTSPSSILGEIIYHLGNFYLILIAFITSIYLDHYTNSNLLSISLLVSLIASALITKSSIPLLKENNFKQIFKKEGPKSHFQKKETPTMGGLLIIPAGLLIANILNRYSENYIQILGLGH